MTNYYPFGATYCDATGTLNTDFQPYKYNGKELDKMHGLNTYDYGARRHDPILGRWDRMDPLCEKYYSVSPYAYCGNNPIILVDPDGREWRDIDGNLINDTKNIKTFIFYSSDFVDQAKVQYNEAIEKSGEGSVAMSLTSTAEQFSDDWGNMCGENIQKVMIMTHGKNQSITLDNNGKQQLTSTGNGKTNISGSKALNVQDLPAPKGNISHAILYMYSCHSADTQKSAHGTAAHKQGALMGSKDPIAYAFEKKFNFKETIGTSGSVNYNSFFTNGTPKWSDNYYKPYPQNHKWTYIIRKRN